jgi:ABC-type Co2+ transport system permease subunit
MIKEKVYRPTLAGIIAGLLVMVGHFLFPGFSILKYLFPGLIVVALRKRNVSLLDGLIAGLATWGTIYYSLLFIYTNKEFIFKGASIESVPSFFGIHAIVWCISGVLTVLAIKEILKFKPSQ